MTNTVTNKLDQLRMMRELNVRPIGRSLPTVNPVPAKAAPASVAGGSTYKYRDADKWRAYMADYMRKRRAHP